MKLRSVHFGAMFDSNRSLRCFACLAIGAVVAITLPAVATAHAELETSSPADGATVPSPFAEPIVMTFSAALAVGSRADLLGPDGATVASAAVDGPLATMTITLDAPLAPGEYDVKWVSVADDGDLERGTVSFTVAAAPPTASPSASPTAASPTAPATAAAEGSAPSSVPPSASPAASPIDSAANPSTGDILLPIVAGLIVVVMGALYLLSRRNRPTLPR